MTIGRLHLITAGGDALRVLDATRTALRAGAPVVQVRRKTGTDLARLSFAADVHAIARETGATCIVDDRIDVALAVGADGVHVGVDDLPVEAARRLLAAGAIVGATCRHADDARRAVDAGATYLGVGPVFATSSKTGLPDPIGLAGLEGVVDAVTIPVVAIAGITVDRVAAVLDVGAYGVAVMGAVYDAPDVADVVAEFLAALDEPAHRHVEVTR